MNIVYLIGLLLAIFFVFFGISVNMDGLIPSIELGNLQNFFDVPSILITIGGTLAVMVACYPKLAKSFPKHIEIMLRAKAFNPTIYVDQLTELAQIARKNGLLALEEKRGGTPRPGNHLLQRGKLPLEKKAGIRQGKIRQLHGRMDRSVCLSCGRYFDTREIIENKQAYPLSLMERADERSSSVGSLC